MIFKNIKLKAPPRLQSNTHPLFTHGTWQMPSIKSHWKSRQGIWIPATPAGPTEAGHALSDRQQGTPTAYEAHMAANLTDKQTVSVRLQRIYETGPDLFSGRQSCSLARSCRPSLVPYVQSPQRKQPSSLHCTYWPGRSSAVPAWCKQVLLGTEGPWSCTATQRPFL